MFTNIRLGVATNSSSTHSLVILNGKYRTVYPRDPDIYGWDDFLLTTANQKRRYFGSETDKDHQSVTAIPNDQEFLKDIEKFIVNNERIAVVGGNDNEESDTHNHKIERAILNDWFACGEGVGHVRSRKEDDGLWTIFSKNNRGWARCTVDLANPQNPRKFGKTKSPLLVDVKVTDLCGYGCDYCYQGSTTKGKHAEYTEDFVQWCVDNEVFEIAIGGGEPTTWPHLSALIDDASARGVLPNMTTRNLSYVRSNKEMIENKMGGVAISIDNLNILESIIKTRSEFPKNLNIQVVVGSTSQQDFEKIIKIASQYSLGITLLGWKYTGRGSDVNPQEVDWTKAIDYVDSIGIDTCLAKASQERLKELKIPPYTYTVEEGLQSMYVDLVERKFARSSFCDETHDFVNFGEISEAWMGI